MCSRYFSDSSSTAIFTDFAAIPGSVDMESVLSIRCSACELYTERNQSLSELLTLSSLQQHHCVSKAIPSGRSLVQIARVLNECDHTLSGSSAATTMAVRLSFDWAAPGAVPLRIYEIHGRHFKDARVLFMPSVQTISSEGQIPVEHLKLCINYCPSQLDDLWFLG